MENFPQVTLTVPYNITELQSDISLCSQYWENRVWDLGMGSCFAGFCLPKMMS